MRVLASAICILAISGAAFAQQGDLLGGPFDPPVEREALPQAAPTAPRSVVVVAPARAQNALTPLSSDALIDARPAVPILATAPAEPLPTPPAAVAAIVPAPMVAEAPLPDAATHARSAAPRLRRSARSRPPGETTLASVLAPAPPQPSRILDGPAASLRIGYGYNFCLDAQGGLRGPGEERVPALILWPCNSRDNQNVALAGGAIRFSALREHYVRPATAPMSGCTTHPIESLVRAYVFRICAGDGEPSIDASDPARVVVTSYAPAGAPVYGRGAPMFVDRLDGAAPAAQWEFVRRGNLLRLSGTDLCITPPSRDVAQNAPLYLDRCSAPHQLGAEPRDGVQRARATFVIDWRF